LVNSCSEARAKVPHRNWLISSGNGSSTHGRNLLPKNRDCSACSPKLTWQDAPHEPRRQFGFVYSTSRAGKDTAQLVEEAVDRMLEYDARFTEAVDEGRAAVRRGDLLEHDEVVERIEQMFRS